MCSTNFDTLIIAGGLAPNTFEYDESLYGKTIAADSGYDKALELGIKIDEVVGDFDSTKYRTEILSLGYKKAPRDKDETDTELAIRKKLGPVYDLLGAGGGRIDHLFSVLALFRVYGLPRYWFTDSDVLLGFQGEGYIDSKAGEEISFLPLFENADVKSDGLVWELGDRPLSLTFISQSNRFRNDRVFITSDKPLLIRVAPESFKRGMLTLI